MRVCLAIALFVALSLPSMLSAEQQFGGVVRIHFDESPVPDLSVIQDTYEGSGPTICAHIVIDSLPEGVSGYHLAYEIISEDSSVVVLQGFHPSAGWVILDKTADFTLAGEREVAQTPVSVGYWRLWLKRGAASRCKVWLRATQGLAPVGIGLLNGRGEQWVAARASHGAVNAIAPEPTEFREIGVLTSDHWAGTPQVSPAWVLVVDGDSARVVRNSFADSLAPATGGKPFPVGVVQVRRCWVDTTDQGRPVYRLARVSLQVSTDGTLPRSHIEWLSKAQEPPGSRTICKSTIAGITLMGDRGAAEVVATDGRCVSRLPFEIAIGDCFDATRRIAVVAKQEATAGGRLPELNKMIVLDYEGNTVYEGAWTDCHVVNLLVGANPNVLRFWLDGCAGAGEYLYRIDEGAKYRLEDLPDGGRCFSPDSRTMLINREGDISVYDSSHPEGPRLLWRKRVVGAVTDIAISDGARLVAYRLKGGASDMSMLVVAAGDGNPVCRLLEGQDLPTDGPLLFVGEYLCVGNHVNQYGPVLETRRISLFDLSTMTVE